MYNEIPTNNVSEICCQHILTRSLYITHDTNLYFPESELDHHVVAHLGLQVNSNHWYLKWELILINVCRGGGRVFSRQYLSRGQGVHTFHLCLYRTITPRSHKWVPKTADVIFVFHICHVHLSWLISCYYLISTVLYQKKSYKLYYMYWIWDIISENPGLKSENLRLQVSMVGNRRIWPQRWK